MLSIQVDNSADTRCDVSTLKTLQHHRRPQGVLRSNIQINFKRPLQPYEPNISVSKRPLAFNQNTDCKVNCSYLNLSADTLLPK